MMTYSRSPGMYVAGVAALIVAGVVASSMLRSAGHRADTPIARLLIATEDPRSIASAHGALDEIFSSFGEADGSPFVDVLTAIEPDQARALVPVLVSWSRWTDRGAPAIARAIDSPQLRAHVVSETGVFRERWRGALISLYGAELRGRLRAGETVGSLMDAAAERERAGRSPVSRLVAAFQMGAAAIRSNVPAEAVVSAGENLLGRADSEDRAAGAELVRLNAARLDDGGRRGVALRNLLEAAGREQSRRTFFFIADGIRRLNEVVPQDVKVTLADLRNVYGPAGCRWRATCLAALSTAERTQELRRLVQDLEIDAETVGDDTVDTVRVVLTLGDAATQMSALGRWACAGGERELEVFDAMAMRAAFRSPETRGHVQQRVLEHVQRAALRTQEDRTVDHLLARFVLENAAVLRSEDGYRRRLGSALLPWAMGLDGQQFWHALLAWGSVVAPADFMPGVNRVVEGGRAGRREQLAVMNEGDKERRRSLIAALRANAEEYEARWWKLVQEGIDVD